MTSALSRLAANSNDVLVLVLGSKKRLTTVLPRNAGTFLFEPHDNVSGYALRMTTRSSSPFSSRWTSMASSRDVGIFLPM